MRDPKRIHSVLTCLGILWWNHPDMRFGELYEYIMADGDERDGFYIEDDVWERRMLDRIEADAELRFSTQKITS